MGENGSGGFGGWRIGIDVGGTNTDAVVLDHTDALVSKVKHPTTPDVTTGILRALEQVLAQVPGTAQKVRHVMLGTTHATNAILERRNLNRVAALRLGGPATHSIPPLAGWPTELRLAVSCGEVILDGGVEMTGEPIVALDEDGARRFLESVAGQVECVAVSGVFSPVRADQEFRIEELVRQILGEVPVSLSHEIGSLGLLERENACVLNAALVGVAGRVTAGLTNAMTANGIAAEAYIAQNDGTLMSLDYVRRYPILTIGSGPTNSMRGASYLTGATDALVVDVGGTSTDIGILASGFPRESSNAVEIGGVRTNFRMPDLVSVAIGGGTVLTEKDGAVVLGPNSVGYRLPKEALVFGGGIPTLTDAIVAVGRASGIGNAALAVGRGELFSRAIAECDARVEDAVDRVKTSGRELPLIAVGGGSGLIPETLDGVAGVLRPEHYEVANAIGAAIASVSGEVDRMFAFGKAGRDEAIAEAVRLAREEAIRAGADPAHVEIVEIDEIPLAYLTEPVARVRVKAAGPLKNG